MTPKWWLLAILTIDTAIFRLIHLVHLNVRIGKVVVFGVDSSVRVLFIRLIQVHRVLWIVLFILLHELEVVVAQRALRASRGLAPEILSERIIVLAIVFTLRLIRDHKRRDPIITSFLVVHGLDGNGVTAGFRYLTL